MEEDVRGSTITLLQLAFGSWQKFTASLNFLFFFKEFPSFSSHEVPGRKGSSWCFLLQAHPPVREPGLPGLSTALTGNESLGRCGQDFHRRTARLALVRALLRWLTKIILQLRSWYFAFVTLNTESGCTPDRRALLRMVRRKAEWKESGSQITCSARARAVTTN